MEYFTKICWNNNSWEKPSGLDGKSNTGYERENGYGHEEWLLNTSKLIDGYHYSHLQSVSKCEIDRRKELNNFDITLFSRQNSNPVKLWKVGVIQEVEAINTRESAEIVNEYRKNGWLDEMETQLIDVNANTESFNKQVENAGGFACIRFKPENLHLNLELIESVDVLRQFSKSFKHYNLFKLEDLNIEPSEIISRIPFEAGHTPKSPNTRGGGSYEKQKENDCVHIDIQNKTFDILSQNYTVKTERKVETGGFVDIVVEIATDCEIFYEIKTNNTVRECIREAFGQIMEYAYYPNNHEVYERATGLVIVSQNAINASAESYIDKLREFGINIYYQQFNLVENILEEAYPPNPLEVECG
jgi:hypothetical protein